MCKKPALLLLFEPVDINFFLSKRGQLFLAPFHMSMDRFA